MDGLWDDTFEWALKMDEEFEEIVRKTERKDDDTDRFSLEDVLDEHPKLQRRLTGRDIFHGRSLMLLRMVLNVFQQYERNPILKVYNRPRDDRSLYVTDIDKLLNIIDSHDKPLSKRETWDIIMEKILEQGKVLDVKEQHKIQQQLQGVFSVEATEVPTPAITHQNHHAGQMTWFRWGGKYYNPFYLYTLKHGKEFQFEIWEKDVLCVDYSTRYLAHLYSSKELLKRYEMGWKKIQRVSAIVCFGERPIIKQFPNEYYQFKKKDYKKKQARCKKTRGTSLSIVTNPENLGFVKIWRISYFHTSTRQWICIGNIPGNVDAKTPKKIDLSEYAIETNRMRMEPLEISGSGQFELEIQPQETDQGHTEDKGKKHVQYELEIPVSAEQNKYCKKRKSNWNSSTIEKKHGNFKKLNSTRRGKLYQHMISQACED